VTHLRHPTPITNPTVNYIVLALAMVFEGIAWYFAFNEFNRTKGKWGYLEAVQRGKDPTLFVVLFEDSAAMLGLVIAFLGVGLAQLTGILYFDAIASILIGLVLGGTAAWLAHETKGLLIGEAANERVVSGIRNIVIGFDEVDHINDVLTMHMGPDYVLLNLAVKFKDDKRANELEEVVRRIEEKVKAEFPRVKRIFVEAERRRI